MTQKDVKSMGENWNKDMRDGSDSIYLCLSFNRRYLYPSSILPSSHDLPEKDGRGVYPSIYSTFLSSSEGNMEEEPPSNDESNG